jgi:RNA polymerase sigma-70 factor, ECF subfamily
LSATVQQFQLVRQLIERRAGAWCAFVEDNRRVVLKQIIQTAGHCRFDLDGDAIEDICADVFASLLADDMRSLRQFRGEAKLSTWLSVIARRTCMKEISRLKRDPGFRPTALAEATSRLATAETGNHRGPLEAMIHAEQHDRIRVKLQSLSARDRELLEMYFDQKLSHEEISRRSGISINSVGPKIHRSIHRLRRLLEAK